MQKWQTSRRHFGWWREEEIDAAPNISDWVDLQWQPPDFDQLLGYLRGARTVCVTTSPYYCPLCNVDVGPFTYQSDGEWIWPSWLAHVVQSHGVRLPDAFVDRIRVSNYAHPTAEIDLQTLDWPFGPVGGWHPYR